MKPKTYTIGKFILKSFFATCIVLASLFILRYANYVIDWAELSSGWIDGPLSWICIIYGIGTCSGITVTWLLWEPDITTLAKRLTTPTLINHALYTICIIIKEKGWGNYVNFDQLYELQKKK